MIAHDTISKTFTILAIIIILYLSTFSLSLELLFPSILLISGIIMQLYESQKIEYVDSVFEEETSYNILFYTLIALAGIGISTFFSPIILSVKPIAFEIRYTGFQLMLFGVLMAIAEEQFFRGFITNFLLKFSSIIAILGSAGIFAVYHLAVYGTKPEAIIYVFIGGMILAYVAIRSQRLSPTMIAHSIVNVLAVMK
jgi:membrane protease YdiL (CAAX protease family)